MVRSIAWKSDERRVAKQLGGTRVGLSGGPGALSKADVLAGPFFVEVKRRARSPIAVWFGEASVKASMEGKVPVLIFHVLSSNSWLAVLNLEEFRALYHRIGVLSTAGVEAEQERKTARSATKPE